MVLSPEPVLLPDLPVTIDRAEVLRWQGYRVGLDVPTSEVVALFEEARDLADSLLAPCVVYRAVAARAMPDDRVAAGGQTFGIPGIRRLWGDPAWVGIAVATIGAALERRVGELFEAREFPLAMMLDSIGSAATESLAEAVNTGLCEWGVARALKVTNRISPGYAGWPVTDQRGLFTLCPGDRAGVALNPACVMTPVKSISLMVAIGPTVRVDHSVTQCRRCWMRDCAYRRAPRAALMGEAPRRSAG